jgi:ubiquinone/menaquinone biosynthesis C-methylase UbiE
MRRLMDARENLDGALTDRTTLEGNLLDLRRINRLTGGTSLSVRAIRSILGPPDGLRAGNGAVQVLDVGTGAADIPLALAGARGPWSSIHVTAVDSRREILEAAQAVTPALRSAPAVELALADGRALPFADRSFDVAHASLVLHHLEPPDALTFLRELGRVARRGVVVNDLARGWWAWFAAWLILHAVSRNRFTRHDGPLSVRRAYTPDEMRALIESAGLRPVAELRGLAGHRWAFAGIHR